MHRGGSLRRHLRHRCPVRGCPDADAVKDYLDKHGIEYDMVTSVKVPAIVYVDDRALTFNPDNISTLVKSIKNFQPWQDIPKNKLF